MKEWTGVVLAAGEGSRMKSKIPKVLHTLGGKALINYPVNLLKSAGVEPVTLVVSPLRWDGIRTELGESIAYVIQGEAQGTGHALLQCLNSLNGQSSNVFVIGGDTPLVRLSTIHSLFSLHLNSKAMITMLTSSGGLLDDMGRVRRDSEGVVETVVEARDDSGRDQPQEVNAGVYCFNADWLWKNLPCLKPGSTGEYYLTDLVSLAYKSGTPAQTLAANDPHEAMGINNRAQLALAEKALRTRINTRWMLEGVTILDPETTYIDEDASIGLDTTILPNTVVQGTTVIGVDCLIGPGSFLRNSKVGNKCKVEASYLEESTLEDNVDVGPFSHLRSNAYIETNGHIGNFAEIKESRLSRGVKMGHFGYVGDAVIGENTNLGAGLVTCNFDGKNKHKTTIGKNVFIGSDTMLVAPINVGDGASTGAGAVVTKNVPPYRLAVGVPARIRERPG